MVLAIFFNFKEKKKGKHSLWMARTYSSASKRTNLRNITSTRDLYHLLCFYHDIHAYCLDPGFDHPAVDALQKQEPKYLKTTETVEFKKNTYHPTIVADIVDLQPQRVEQNQSP